MEENHDLEGAREEETLQSWDSFFSAVLVVLRETSELLEAPLDQRSISYAKARVENCLIGLRRILDRLQSAATCSTEGLLFDIISKVKLLVERFCSLRACWNRASETYHCDSTCTVTLTRLSSVRPVTRYVRSISGPSDSETHSYSTATTRVCDLEIATGGKGRPCISIERSQVEYLRSLQFSWTEIASIVGVSRMTLYRRRHNWGLLGRGFFDISDEDFEALVVSIKAEMPDVGERMLLGALVARGVKVSRERLRLTVQKVDPINTALRWSSFVIRRPYSVPGSNSLWHLGN